MAKSVAALAAEQDLDEANLVQVLRHLVRRRHVESRWNGSYWESSRTLLTVPQAAKLLGLRSQEIEKLLAPEPEWNVPRVLDALFAFHRKHRRWPGRHEWRSDYRLPSPWKLTRIINPDHYGWSGGWTGNRRLRSWQSSGTWRRPWDVLQRELAKDPRCTARMALQLTNVLARREAIQRIGFDNLVKANIDVVVVDSHPEFGTLYSLPGETPDERMYLVKVINSTAEPDGTFADYYLRVPPYESVQLALAWTFRLDEKPGHEYRPLVET